MSAVEPRSRVLVIPGLDGSPGIVRAAAPRLFPTMRPLFFDHHLDPLDRGIDGLASRALALVEADGADDGPVFVCGESFGGAVALTLACQFPHRFSGLILLSAFARYPALASRCGRMGLCLWTLLGNRLAERIFRIWRPLGMPGALGLYCSSDVVAAYLDQPPLHLPGYRAKCELALTFDARSWLREIDCPTIILTGTWDPVVPTRAGRELMQAIPRAELHRLPGTHLVHFVRAAEAGDLIADWAARVLSGAFAERPARDTAAHVTSIPAPHTRAVTIR